VLPARPGEVIRPYLLARQEGLSATATFATIVVERLLDSVTVVLMLASFVLFFDPGMAVTDSTTYQLVRMGGLFVGSATLALLAVMFFAARDPRALGRWAYKVEHVLPGKVAHKLAGLLHSFAEGLAVVRAPKRLFVALMLSVPVWLSIALGVWTVILGFHIALPFTGSFLLLALLAVGVSVPTPGGVGGFEAAIQIGLTKFYLVPNDTAVGAALVLHATSILPTVVLGFLFLIQDGLKLGSMQKLASAAAHGETP
jgi:glycosyltransferase 2 family protein